MKHGKRRMLGAMVKAGGMPLTAQGRPPACYLVEVNSRKNARGEQKREKRRRLYSAET
jgi:hypothetical protein